ncbi:hypothetical protein QCM77_24090 [Bradyrhizobium sp. SSUT18]|uniref:hypothetical protein n=1 Tax=Bradyrhizobium sp. SSUT18 TaxID=3040602 RepID=UPI00244BEF8F|nr:hypothetical protein [Bradyrhizobium sp. SSUT18]MDH2403012.1 hypothetical protein [Bradyrhizobium sp. SSUT18]
MIYVVDIDRMSLAFAAGSKGQAIQIVRSSWFARAIGRSCLGRPGSKTSNHHPRVATVQELVAFHEMSTEFSDVMADVLVARVG